MEHEHVHAGEHILRQGETSTDLFVLESGEAYATTKVDGGTIKMVHGMIRVEHKWQEVRQSPRCAVLTLRSQEGGEALILCVSSH